MNCNNIYTDLTIFIYFFYIIGVLLKEITTHFIDKRNGILTPNRSMWIYSAHDATISALLNTFGSFDIHFPPYAAAVLLELREKAGMYYVTVSSILLSFLFPNWHYSWVQNMSLYQ